MSVALYARAWVEIRAALARLRLSRRRPPCEGVGRNEYDPKSIYTEERRPPCEGVGRNQLATVQILDDGVALHVRAWVEIPAAPVRPLPSPLSPSM